MKITTKKLTTCAILAALYVALSFVSFGTNDFRVSVESMTILIGGLALGPVGGVLIAGIGEFFHQIFAYGMDPTTVLWLLPYMAEGLVCGLLVKGKKEVSTKRLISTIIIGEIVLTILVTAVNAASAVIQGWGTVFTVLAGVPLRLAIMLVRIVVFIIIVPLLYKSLKKVIK